jgi:mutator protein MutT
MIKCYFENGNEAKPGIRHVTVDGLVMKDNKILLVKRASNLTGGGKYAFPGGFLDRDETAEEAIVREVKEETGYQSNKVTLFRVNTNPDRIGEDRQNVDFVFIVEVGLKTSNPDFEVEKIQWYSLGKLPEKDEIAFDHYETLKLYQKYLKENFFLPLFK